jgi:iron(II)-dependent oxidoreductase
VTPEAALTAADCLAAGLPEAACTGVASNGAWTPLIRDFSGVPMALVPAGCFMMGYADNLPEERPLHEICFERPYWVDVTEVTVTQFAGFLNGQAEPVSDYDGWLDVWGLIQEPEVQLAQTGGTWQVVPGHRNRPLENVTWFGATEYCAWRDAYLPSEAEWEYAARGPDSWLYPWGNEFIADNVVRHHEGTPDVGSKPQGASWVGALDMSSSLFEWTHSLYRPYPYDADDGREAGPDVDDTSARVLRGTAWYHPAGMHDNVSATARINDPPGYGAWYFGFRCARPVE